MIYSRNPNSNQQMIGKKNDNRTKDCSVKKCAQVLMCGWGQIKGFWHLVSLLVYLALFQLANQLRALIALVRRPTICIRHF